jgi:hypothetical protein
MSAIHSKKRVVPTITLHIKNMVGDLLHLDVPATMTVQGVVQRLTMMDSTLYPRHRTKVLRLTSLESKEDDADEADEAKEEPLTDGEMLAVFVGEGVAKETGVYPDNAYEALRGKFYTRFLFPLKDILEEYDYKGEEVLYVYPLTDTELHGENNHDTYFRVSLCSEPFLSGVVEPGGYILYTLVDYLLRTMVRVSRGPAISPEKMKLIQDTVDAYYEELGRENNMVYHQSYHLKEAILCECGAFVQRSGLPSHRKTKKHVNAVSSM